MKAALPLLQQQTASFWRARRGNVLMIFAFALLPLTYATGMGVDYTGAMMLQTKLNGVADAASLAAVTKPMMQKSMLNACDAARSAFVTQSAGIPRLTINTAAASDLTVTITDTYPTGSPVVLTCPVVSLAFLPLPTAYPTKRVAAVTYSGESQNSFGAILGMATLHIKGAATALTSLAPFIDIHVALDTSQSMGLAATDADATKLWQKTTQLNGRGCQFGCHVQAPGEPYANEAIANANGIRLRVNVLRDATADMIQTAIDNQATANNYRFGLYRISSSLSDIQTLTPNLSNAKSAATSVTLGPNNSSGVGDTNLADTMASMLPKITAHGDGTTQANARAFLFLVTDGVADVAGGGCTYGHCTRPIDPATCTAYKAAGITVGIVYTTYLPVKANPLNPNDPTLRDEYLNLVKRFSANGYISPNPMDNSADIAPALQACASTGYYFEASDGPAIHAAMQRLFTQASQTPTLSH